MMIETVSDFRRAMRHGPWAWPGGYPCYFVLSDGEALSFAAAKHNRRLMLEALTEWKGWSDWRPVALEINWEDADLLCVHSGERIPSAYAD